MAILIIGHLRRQPRWLAALLPATLWQSFIRSDVTAILGIAVLVFAFMPAARELFGSRRFALITGGCVLTLAVAVQALLQFVLYPHATYAPDGQPVTFFYNLHPRILATFFIAMLPYALLSLLVLRRWRRLGPADILALGASLLYLPLWFTVGIVSEVRIFVPFLLLVTPAAAKLLLRPLSTQP